MLIIPCALIATLWQAPCQSTCGSPAKQHPAVAVWAAVVVVVIDAHLLKMKKLLFVLGVWVGLSSVALHAESPFVVTPRVERAGDVATVVVAFTVPTNHLLYSDKLHLDVAGSEAGRVFVLPEPSVIQDKFSGAEKKVFASSFEAKYSLPPGATQDLSLKVHFQGCDVAECFFPEDQEFKISTDGTVARMVDAQEEVAATTSSGDWKKLAAGVTVANRGSGYLGEKDFLSFLDKSESGASDGVTVVRSGFFGLLFTMVLIVLGGAALNLTPCILPMIPINLAIIGAGAQAGSKKKGFALGATYAAGMAIAYGVLGLVVVLTGAKFGTLNSSPWFNLGIAAVFLVLALGMFDIVSIDLSRFQSGSAAGSVASKSKFIVAYTMGTVAALLAGACVAPVVISVLLQATALHAKGMMIGLLLPFLLGLGMGLPWPFAGAGLSFLPKPGKWMVRVKYGFGVMIVLFAAYYGHLAVGLFRNETTMLARATGSNGAKVSAKSLTEELTRAIEASSKDGRPVFVDFAASWCKNCSAMEHTTFASQTVKQRLAAFHEVRIQAEKPNESPAREVLDHFGVMGLPSYVVLKPSAVQK